MRDLKKEETDSPANVASSANRVVSQEKLIAGLSIDSPDLPSAKRLLGQMQQSESAARTNHAMIEYDNEDQR